MEKRSLAVMIIGIVAYLVYIFAYVGIDKLVYILAKVNVMMIMLSMIFLLISILLHGLSWHILISENVKGVSKTISATIASLFASYVVPIGAASELVRFFIATRLIGISVATTVLSILVHRISTTLAPLIALLFLILYLRGELVVIESATIATILAVYLVVIVFPNVLVMGLIKTRIFEKLMRRYEKYLSRIIGDGVSTFSEEYRRSMAGLISRPRFPLALGISLIEWLFLVASMYAIFLAISLNKDLVIAAVSIIMIQILWWVLPISFAGSIGITDLLASIAYQLLNFEPGVSASIVVIYRLVSLTSLLILLYPSLRILGIYPREIRRIYRESQDMKTDQAGY
ncbi:MAG TPA: lysylphosphatidylglycerol synthase transmembrane domain-containing protein [Sulfolobales archaeon]|nr:lysylphosphatidylglycerol synthase transmembrane domain-containing protein [Sulfolobales archaeon]